jgi:hypothetical protein
MEASRLGTQSSLIQVMNVRRMFSHKLLMNAIDRINASFWVERNARRFPLVKQLWHIGRMGVHLSIKAKSEKFGNFPEE